MQFFMVCKSCNSQLFGQFSIGLVSAKTIFELEFEFEFSSGIRTHFMTL